MSEYVNKDFAQFSMTNEQLSLLSKFATMPDTPVKANLVDQFWNNLAAEHGVEVESISPAGFIDMRIFYAKRKLQ